MALVHRPYQKRCIQTIVAKREAGVRRQLISKATGLGKSSTLAGLVPHMDKGAQMMAIAHREELVQQLAEEMALWNPSASIGIEMGELKADGREDVIVGGVQTLGAASGAKRLNKFDPRRCHWLVVDECHHATAATYKRVIDHFLVNPAATLAGFTATPNRADGQAMGQVFDEIVFQYSMFDGIKDGWLSDVHGIQLKTNTDLSKLTKKELKTDETLSRAVNTIARNEAIVRGWIEHCWPRQTMVFSVDVRHAKDLCAAFVRQGIKAAYSWGEDPERGSKLKLFKNKLLDVLINCKLWIEGFNYRMIECIIPAAPSNSQSDLVQKVGRGTRLDERIDNLVEWRRLGLLTEDMKTNCLVMDPVDLFGRHSLTTLPSLFGLSPQLDMQGASITQVMAAIKSAQERFPNADVSALEDFSKLETFAQSANLWAVRFAEETQAFSELQWSKRSDGVYTIRLPKNEYFRVSEDLVGNFDIEGVLNKKTYEMKKLGSLADAVSLVEKTVTSTAPDLLKLLGREQKWRKAGVTAGQMKQLQKLKVPDSQIVQFNRGAASDFISSKFNKKA